MLSIIIYEETGADRRGEPVVGGVPVPRGALDGGGWFELVAEDGNTFVVEGVPAATWPDGSVKWLHVCGLVDLAGGRANTFTLAPGADAADQRLRVEMEGDRVRIRGGALDVDIGTDPADCLSVQRPGGQPLLKQPGLSATLAFAGPDGKSRRTFSLSFADAAPEVVVESANRVVVRLPGVFVNGEGKTVSELILFMEVLRQVPEVRLQPVLVYLGRSREDLIPELTVRAHVPIETGQCHYAFGEDRGPGLWSDIQPVRKDARTGGEGPRWPFARQVQLGSSFYRIEKLTFRRDASWLKMREGRRAEGWCHVTDGRLGLSGGMRYFWEEYPHSLEIDCEEGVLSFGLVPRGAEPLDLRRYSPIKYGPSVYESGGEGPFNWQLHGAYGIAKAHELMLRFCDPDAERKDIAQRALFFTRPARLTATPEAFARSEVVGRLAPVEPSRNRNAEEVLARITDFLVNEREVRGWYGLMDYGDVMSSFLSEEDRWAYDDGGYAWLNTESIPDYGLWLSALRSGRADWLDAAIDMSRHNRDVDCYHRGELRGLGSRHNVNHWGDADKEWRVSMPLARRLHYYVTADPWTAEHIANTVAVYQSYTRTTRIAPGITSALAGVLAKSEITGEEKDIQTLRNLADAYARAVLPDGQFAEVLTVDLSTGEGNRATDKAHQATFFMNTFGGQHALVEAAELLCHEPLLQALSRHAGFWVESGKSGVHVLPFLALAWRHTGEERFREATRKAIEGLTFELEPVGGDGAMEVPRHMIMPGLVRRNKVTCHGLGDPMHCVPYGLAIMGS